MKISVIVPAFNEEKMIGNSLAAIREAALAFEGSAEWELIVCDNNSTDGTSEIARAAGARVVFEPINQIARARNRGASIAGGDWLIFVDADSFPTRELFGRALEEINNPRCAGGGCLLRLDQTEAMSVMFLGLWNFVSRITGWAAGSFVYCDTRLFRELGGFSERLFASEEIEFCKRLKKLARAERRRLRIITDVRMITSARKMHLYTKSEHFWFLLRAGFRPGRILTSRDECALWYNGRR
jgi:glycosyltransferase involved in cell wall biosynthesis